MIEMELEGSFHGLAMKIGKIGGEHITFVITTHGELWKQLKAFNGEEVEVVLRAKQAKLPLKNGGDPDAADPRQNTLPGTTTEPTGRAKKVPKGEHAPTD